MSRTGSKATQDGYRFEIREFTRWRDRHHPHLHLREINPAFCQDWVSQLREQVEAGLMKPRTFNRRIAAISSLYQLAAEPSHSAVTGVPRNLMPPRSLLHAEKSTRPLTPEQFGLLKQQVTSGGGDTTLSFVGTGYKITGLPVFATTAATEGKVLLADMSATLCCSMARLS